MKKTLANLAAQLSDADIREILRLKKGSGKQAAALRQKRERLAAKLSRIDEEIAALTGGAIAEVAKPPRKIGKRGPTAKKRGRKSGKRARTGLSTMIRDIVAASDEPLRSSDIVDRLPAAGFAVADVADTRKKVVGILATRKNVFQQAGRGLYQIAK